MSFALDIEGWFEHTKFEVDHHHPGGGEEFQIDVKICTELGGDHNIKLQLSESSARRLRDKLTTALHDAYWDHEAEHRTGCGPQCEKKIIDV
jgi:hypothetical protein